MSQRRMFSLEVIDTDAFLEMPVSSQLLYFHLSARADDDGFVANPKKILRMSGSGSDDLKVLKSKKFIIEFEDGVCVIKHWRINNFIRKDIYKETKYLDLKRTLFIRANGAYTQNDDGFAIPVPSGHFQIEDVNDTLTQRQLSIEKVRIGKDSIGKDSSGALFGEFNNVSLTDDEYKKLCDVLGEQPTQNLIAELSSYLASSGKRYKSHYATLQNWARRKIQEHQQGIAKKTKGIVDLSQ